MSSAVVVGSGSAGRRHLAALRHEDPGLRITLVRRAGSTGLPATVGSAASRVVRDLEDALDEQPDLAVVASPAPFHVDQIRELLERGAVVLSEKPLAADLAAATTLQPVEGVRRRLLVGYHLRFGDTATTVRELVASGDIGALRQVDLHVGQHLAGWRPGTDPGESVSARQELGGGVLLELSHELDALRFVVGSEVGSVLVTRSSRSGAPTDGVVETDVDLRLTMVDDVEATVHLDMVSDPARRTWRFIGSHGEITADLLAGTITVARRRAARPSVIAIEPGDRDRAEGRLIRHLVDIGREGLVPACGISDGLAALAIVEAARRSTEHGATCAVPPIGATV